MSDYSNISWFNRQLSLFRKFWDMTLMHSIPDPIQLEEGLVFCKQCKNMLTVAGLPPLAMIRCPNCGMLSYSPLKIEEFWLFQPLGSGGEGTVWLAFSEINWKLYAVKLLSRSNANSEDRADSLLAEGQTGLSIEPHPNIATTVAAGESDCGVYLISELVHGERLDSLINRCGALPTSVALDIAIQILEAEKHIIASGYLYRDMKPENIFITSSGKVLIIDFGLAIPLNIAAGSYNQLQIEGSPFYMPPERVSGDPEYENSEIYSIGMIFYQMIVGHTFFKQDKIENVVHRHVEGLRLPLCGALPQGDDDLVQVVERMISRDPKTRFQTIDHTQKILKQLYLRYRKAGKPSFKAFLKSKKEYKNRLLYIEYAILVIVLLVYIIWFMF